MLVWGRWVPISFFSCMHLTLVARTESSGLLRTEDRTVICIMCEKLSRNSRLTVT